MAEEWCAYHYWFDFDGTSCLTRVHFDESAVDPAARQRFAHEARVEVMMRAARDDGQPSEEEFFALLNDLRPVIEELSRAGRMVASVDYLGRRELVFETDQPDAFDAAAIERLVGRPVEIMRHEGWRFFDAKVVPQNPRHAQVVTDNKMLHALRTRGIDITRTAMIDHHFDGADDEVEAIRDALAADNFEVVSCAEGRLHLRAPHRLADISDLTDKMVWFAGTKGCRYEGWGALTEG